MNYNINFTVYYTNHAVKQMFQRAISTLDVEMVLKNGEIIMNYPDDKPFPSMLLLAYIEIRPLHVVCSVDNESQTIMVITAYEPSLDIWESDFKTRKKQ